jgi:hypothetical protein
MLAGPPPSCGRLPAPGPRHSTAVHAPCRPRLQEMLARCYPSHGQRCSHTSAAPRAPHRASRGGSTARAAWPRGARHPSVPALPRPPRACHWSRMPPTIQAHGGPAPCLPISEMLSEDDSPPGRRRVRRSRPGGGGDARRTARARRGGRATVVTVAEILKNNGLAVEKKIMTSTVDVKDDSRSRPMQKAKIEILLGKTEKFDELMAAAAEEREAAAAAEGEEQG